MTYPFMWSERLPYVDPATQLAFSCPLDKISGAKFYALVSIGFSNADKLVRVNKLVGVDILVGADTLLRAYSAIFCSDICFIFMTCYTHLVQSVHKLFKYR